jgi:hypothetical protein
MDDPPEDDAPMDANGSAEAALTEKLFGPNPPAAPDPPRRGDGGASKPKPALVVSHGPMQREAGLDPGPIPGSSPSTGQALDGATAGQGQDGGDDAPKEIDTPAYGFLARGPAERPGFIELQRLGGDSELGNYAMLHRVQWRPRGVSLGRGQAIVLKFTDGLGAVILGRNLRPVLDGIRRQRVYRVVETGEEAARFLPPKATAVYRLVLSGVEEEEGEEEGEAAEGQQ